MIRSTKLFLVSLTTQFQTMIDADIHVKNESTAGKAFLCKSMMCFDIYSSLSQ